MEVVGDAANGKKGWELFLEQSPDVVITDIVMPERNGIELARKIKEKAPRTKILLLSCHRDFEYAQEGLNIGASGYILKTAFQDQEFEEYLQRFADELEKQEEKINHTDEESVLKKEFYGWLCGFENSFPDLLMEACESDWQWVDKPFYIYHLNRIRELNFPELEMHGMFPDGFQHIPCGHDQCFLFISEKYKDQLDEVLGNSKRNNSRLQYDVNGPNLG